MLMNFATLRFFFIFKHLWALNKSWKIIHGVLEKSSWSFVSKRVETLCLIDLPVFLYACNVRKGQPVENFCRLMERYFTDHNRIHMYLKTSESLTLNHL